MGFPILVRYLYIQSGPWLEWSHLPYGVHVSQYWIPGYISILCLPPILFAWLPSCSKMIQPVTTNRLVILLEYVDELHLSDSSPMTILIISSIIFAVSATDSAPCIWIAKHFQITAKSCVEYMAISFCNLPTGLRQFPSLSRLVSDHNW